MLKKSCAILMSCLMLGVAAPLPVLAETAVPVKTVTRSEKRVEVECPQVVGGNSAATEKINSALSRQVASFVSEASTLGGGKVHYDVHKADENVISLTLVMTPNTGVEETLGMTFDRKTGNQKPLSSYYNATELAQRSENGLRYLYDVDEAKLQTQPDTYYVDKDGSIIGLYHAGAVLDKAEGEIEINLSAADVEDSSDVFASPSQEETEKTVKTSREEEEEAAAKAEQEKENEQAKIKAMRERAKKEAEEKAAWEKKQAEKEEAEEAAARKAAAEKAAKEKAEQEKAAEEAASQPKETMKQRVEEYEAREKERQAEEAKREAEEREARLKAEEEARKAAEEKARQEQEAREAAEAEQRAKEAAQAAEKANEDAGQWVNGTITGTEVRMRNSAGLDTDVLGYFEKGETVKVMGSDAANGRKWYRVQRSDGSRGWVAADYCQVGEAAAAGDEGNARTGTITGTDVRVRGSASLSGDILDYYQNGETVAILNEVTADGIRWFKVSRSNGEVGWVAAQYCSEN